MPISEKIVTSISELKAEEDIKELMIDILNREDQGTRQYKKEYEKMIDDLIKKQEGNQ